VGKGITITIAILIVGGGYLLLDRQQFLTQSPPSSTYPNTQPSTSILDFEEAHRFNSTEETQNYRFALRVGKVYRMQTYYEYHYLGDGKVWIKDFSDPEFCLENGFIVRVGSPFAIGFASPAVGRHYLVTPIDVGMKILVVRIEKISE